MNRIDGVQSWGRQCCGRDVLLGVVKVHAELQRIRSSDEARAWLLRRLARNSSNVVRNLDHQPLCLLRKPPLRRPSYSIALVPTIQAAVPTSLRPALRHGLLRHLVRAHASYCQLQCGDGNKTPIDRSGANRSAVALSTSPLQCL